MKKPKRETSNNNREDKRRDISSEFSLDDFGLEPPKIYRESQKARYENYEIQREKKPTQSNGKNLTRTEKRARDNKKRKKRNKLRKIAISLVAVVAFFSVGAVLSLTVFFHINNITVTGETQYTPEEIIAQCTIDKGENLFMSDTNKAKRTIEENLPYIYNAEIKRKLPDKIEIVVEQAKPQYSIKSKDKTYILLDDNFKVLELGAQKSAGISISKADIKTAVPGAQIEFKKDKVGDCLKKLAQVVKDNSLDEITAIYSKSVADNFVVYDDRITFKLGNCDDLEEKIFKCLAAVDQLNKSNPNAAGTMAISSGKEIYFTEK